MTRLLFLHEIGTAIGGVGKSLCICAFVHLCIGGHIFRNTERGTICTVALLEV